MGDIKGFLNVKREAVKYRPVCERIKDYAPVAPLPTPAHSAEQASRCMDCGTPFCHWGCPIGNYIPEWNDLVFREDWKRAWELLDATNNLPEITGRLCPALCEYACVLGINDEPVTIRENELAVVEYAFNHGLIQPRPPQKRTGKRVAVIGSGPAGLSCADQLNKAGHLVVVFEKADKIGGILRYGIPDFKLEKWIVDRRINLFKREGIIFNSGVHVGAQLKVGYLKKEFDAIGLAGGASLPRDLKIEGRNLAGIHFAMDYLIQANRVVAGEKIAPDKLINAKGKKVAVIGGGDTGSDCVGVANRQGASCVVQIEILPQPPECRTKDCPWPAYPLLLKTSTSHEEGAERRWAVLSKKFIGEDGKVKKIICAKAGFSKGKEGCPAIKEVPGSEFEIEAELVILALGFLSPEKKGLSDENFMTSAKGIFCAGDMRRGQSLIVWAVAEGRRAAHCIDNYLMGESNLPMI